MSLASKSIINDPFASYLGIMHRIEFSESKASISAEVWSRVTSERLAVIDDISSCLKVSFFPKERGSRETLQWFLSNGYSVRWDRTEKLIFSPTLRGGGRSGGESSSSSHPKSSKDLAQALRNANPASENYASLVMQAIDLIEAYSKHAVKTPALLQEVTILAQSGSAQICHEILKIIFSQLAAAPLLDLPLLIALRDTLRSTDPQYLDPDDLVKILGVLRAKHESFHTQTTTLPKLYQLIHVLSGVLDVMGDANVTNLSYDNLHDPFYRKLLELSKHEDWRVASQAAYARESLLRLKHDKTKLMLFLSTALDFGIGLNSLRQGILGKDPNALMEAYQRFVNALHTQKKKQSWYEDIRLLIILIENNEFNTFKAHVLSTILNIPQKERHLYLRSVLLILIEFVANHSEEELSVKAIKFMVVLCLENRWGLEKKKKKNKLMPIVQADVLAQFKAWAFGTKPLIAAEARTSLSHFGDPSNIPAAEDFFKREGASVASVALFHEAKARPKNVPEHIERLQKEYVSNDEIKTLLATYIAPQGSYDDSFQDSFSLEQEVMQFLQSDKKVLLLLGGSGAGKTTFGRYLAYHLWKSWTPGQPIVLFIPASTLAISKNVIEETFKRHGFSQQQILQLKQDERFIFIFDGYDEIGKRQNLYHSNRVYEWKAQVIVSCRTQYLSGSYLSLFTPLRDDAPQAILFRELWIAPFTEKEIDAYLKQYLEHSPTSPWSDFREYKKYIAQIPGLQELISTPFLLYIIADVLPDIVQRHANSEPDKKLELLKVDLYDAFVAKWFNRAEVRLRRTGKLPDMGGDIKLSFLAFCKKLAARMFSEDTTIVNYTPPVWGQKESPWEEFFGSNDPLPLLRSAAPLQRVGPNTFAFLHKSLLEYFIYRESFDLMMGEVLDALPSKALFIGRKKGKATEKARSVIPSSLPSNFATKLLVNEPAIIQFYVEAVLNHHSFQKMLFGLIEASKHDHSMAIAAANSITILNAARIPFSGLDLSGIQVSGGNLEGGIFDGTILSEAKLNNCVLKEAYFRDCRLERAQMEGVQFGEYPHLTHASKKGGGVKCISISRDGTFIAGVGGNIVQIWNIESREIVCTLDFPLAQISRHPNWISDGTANWFTSCDFSPDRKFLVFASRDGVIRVWDLEKKISFRSLEGHGGGVKCCVFSPNGKYIASGSDDYTVRIWDVENGETVKVFDSKKSRARVSSCAFSPDGQLIISGHRNNQVKLWDVKAGTLIRVFEGHTGTVSSCAFSPDQKLIVSGGEYNDYSLRIWDVETGRTLHRLYQGHSVFVHSCAFSSNGRFVISGCSSGSGSVGIWDVETGKALKTLEGHLESVESCLFTPNGRNIVSASKDAIRFWDVEMIQSTSSKPNGHTWAIHSIDFSPDGRYVVTGSDDATMCLWDAERGTLLKVIRGHKGGLMDCSFSPNGSVILSGSRDKLVVLWDINTGKALKILRESQSEVHSCVFSPNGKLIASGNAHGVIRVWDAATGETLKIFKGSKTSEAKGAHKIIKSCAFSFNNELLAAGGGADIAQLWNVKTGKLHRTLEGHTENVTACSFSPNQKHLITGSYDSTIRMWNLETGETFKILKHNDFVNSATFSPNGKFILSGCRGGTIWMWDAATGSLLTTWEAHTRTNRGGVDSCVFSSDGKLIASGGTDKIARMWRVWNDNGELEPRLVWSSIPLLSASGVKLENINGLSPTNRLLLKQRGAEERIGV